MLDICICKLSSVIVTGHTGHTGHTFYDTSPLWNFNCVCYFEFRKASSFNNPIKKVENFVSVAQIRRNIP